jgi:hypothetical protein
MTSDLQKWRNGIDKAVGDPRWNEYDCEIIAAVGEYNRHLSSTPGYVTLDWRIIKAMVWVETGANNPQWKTKPIQIGNPGDPGLHVFLSGKEGADLVTPPELKGRLTLSSVITIPSYNIRAGIGYLMSRMATYRQENQIDGESKVFEVTAKAGDSLDRIARAQGSTVETLQMLNPGATVLRMGQIVKCRKAAIRRVISDWRSFNTTTIALNYNGRGDRDYARRLDYALNAVRKEAGLACSG